MRFDIVTERTHYRDHLQPIWDALPASHRGTDWGIGPANLESGRVLLVAGYSDVVRYHNHPVVYVEHGAGQSYIGLPPAVAPYYSPLVRTKQHRNVVAFLCPNQEVADRWSRSYDRPAFVVGCPKLDPWHAGDRPQHDPRTVAITFHWEPPASVWSVVPEMQSGFDCYAQTLREAVERIQHRGWHVIGTYHPRADAVRRFWHDTQIELPAIEVCESSVAVLDRAAILAADNTSLQAEMMSLGRGVVWLNHPQYRRDVEHGGRFWTWPNQSGVQVDTPRDLLQIDLESVAPSTWHPYAYADGHSTERAVEALLSL